MSQDHGPADVEDQEGTQFPWVKAPSAEDLREPWVGDALERLILVSKQDGWAVQASGTGGVGIFSH